MTVPNDFDVPPPLEKITRIGGLCAAIREDEWDYLRRGWMTSNELYDWDIERDVLDEFIH